MKNRKEMIELEYHYVLIPFELTDLGTEPQKLLSLQKERQPDITWLLMKEQMSILPKDQTWD